MKKIDLIFVSLALGWLSPALAQRQALPFLTATTNDRAYILLLKIPDETEGFNVYRKGPGDRDFVLVTPQPIVAVIEPITAREILGADYAWVARALRAEDEFDVVHRLRSDPGAAVAVSFASLRAARVAGRLFVDEKVKRGKTYTYRVEFLDYAGTRLKTAERSVTIRDRRPPGPTRVESKAGDSEVRVSWDFPAYSGDPEDIVVGFNIYRKAPAGDFEKINRVLILRQEDLKYRTDIAVENDQTYSYYVTAVDFIGRESKPSETVTATPKDLTPPKFPQGLKIVPQEGKILVTWKMNLELDLSHYDIYKSLDMNEGYEKINTEPIPADQPRYLDDDVYFGPLFYYKVRAIDRVGNESEFSNAISGRPADSTAPAPPDSLFARVESRYVTLTWLPPADRDLLGFYVYRRRSDQEFLRISGRPLAPDSLTFQDTGYKLKGLWPGKSYEYGVTALDNMYNESPMATIQITVPDDEPPTPPVTSYARSTPEGLVEITWQPSMALDVVGYRIYRGQDGVDPILFLETNDSTYATIDSTAERGKSYAYQVAAVDEAANESLRTKGTIVVPRDLVAPPAPENVKAVVDTAGVRITWDPVGVSDLAGYNVYRSDIPTGTAVKLTSTPILETSFRDPEGKAGLYYRVSSLDTSGHENAEGEAVEAVKATSEPR